MLKLFYLKKSFYIQSASLVEIEQKNDRPYAMVVVKIQGHQFAIPFRSDIRHNHCYPTIIVAGEQRGLDYSKALIIQSSDIDYTKNPKIEQAEFNLLKGKEKVVATQFQNYITLYREAIERKINEKSVMSDSPLLSFSTLQNYHSHLSIK